MPVSSTRRGQHAAALGALVYRVSPTGEYRQTVAPRAAQISPGKMRELSVHKRSIYLKRRTGGLRSQVPARHNAISLIWSFCSSSRTFALRLPPDQPSRVGPCRRLVVTMISMSSFRFSHRGLAPHKFAPVLGAHYTLERTGCKSVTAHEKGMEEYALLVLSVAPVPASQLGRYNSGFKL
jgi:hypothetical protein